MMKLLKTGNSRVAVLKQQRGMTLFELLGVLIVLGIVAAIAIPAVSGVIAQSEKDADLRTRERVANQAELYINALDIDGNCKLDAGGNTATVNVTGVVCTEATISPSAAAKVEITTAFLKSQGYLEETPVSQGNNSTYSKVTVTYAKTGTSTSGVWSALESAVVN